MFNYQVVIINDNEDIDDMFNVYHWHECIGFFELLVQYEQQPSSTTNVETIIPSPQIHQTTIPFLWCTHWLIHTIA